MIKTGKELLDFPLIYRTILGETYYNHDFKSLKNIHQENDAQVYGFEDMHNVRPVLKSTASAPEDVLPLSVLDSVRNAEFWRELDGPDSIKGFDSSNVKQQTFFGEVI